LFSWDELNDLTCFTDSNKIDFRLIDSELGIQKSQMQSLYGQPIEFLTNVNLSENIENLQDMVNINLILPISNKTFHSIIICFRMYIKKMMDVIQTKFQIIRHLFNLIKVKSIFVTCLNFNKQLLLIKQ
jgi:hypothetical protein